MDRPPIEIEHKYLVEESFARSLADGWNLVQSYAPTDDDSSIRVRLIPSKAQYTLTGKGPRQGDARLEIEFDVPREFAELAQGAWLYRTVEKVRHNVFGDDGHVWVVDVFGGRNEGLCLAEIELHEPGEDYVKPEWALEDVTHDERYYNDYLAEHPFSTW